jgi:hypothetical protein
MFMLHLGADAHAIPRKRGLAAEYYYEGETVCVARGERRTVGILKSINGDVATWDGEMIVEVGNQEIHRVSFRDVPNQISKLIGAFSIAPENWQEKLLQRAKVRGQVEAGFRRRRIEMVQITFESHCDKTKNVIFASSLGPALSDLGMHIDEAEVDELLKSRDLNDDGGLDFHEFWSLVCTPSPVEEWVRELPLAQLVADALPCEDRLAKDQLRYLSRITPEQLAESLEIMKESLNKTLCERLVVLKEAFDKLDVQAAASNSKFQISKMSVGNIADFHEGLASRIGIMPGIFTR